MKVVLVENPEQMGINTLAMVIHHLAVDGVSWRIILSDFEQLILGYANGTSTNLGKKTSSYRQWFETLKRYGESSKTKTQISYWKQTLSAYRSLPVEFNEVEPVQLKDISTVHTRLNSLQTENLLKEVPKAYHTEVNDLLISALVKTIANWTRHSEILIGMEGHGREVLDENIDTSRTVGWFSTHYPVVFDLNKISSTDDLIKEVKETLRNVPDKGIGYGVLKYLEEEPALKDTKEWDLLFNYLGQTDNAFKEKGLLK